MLRVFIVHKRSLKSFRQADRAVYLSTLALTDIPHVLQEQLEHFICLLEEIDGHRRPSDSPAITTALFRAKATIEQLNRLLQEKIVRNAYCSAQARRRAWTRNRSKIYRMKAALKEHRANLVAAISVNTLSRSQAFCYL